MGSKKVYFRQDNYDEIFDEMIDVCCPIEGHLEYMKDNNIKQMTVYRAKRVVGSDYFYCKQLGEIGEKAEGGCGIFCGEYKPRNGKSGCCKFRGFVYEETEEELILNI